MLGLITSLYMFLVSLESVFSPFRNVPFVMHGHLWKEWHNWEYSDFLTNEKHSVTILLLVLILFLCVCLCCLVWLVSWTLLWVIGTKQDTHWQFKFQKTRSFSCWWKNHWNYLSYILLYCIVEWVRFVTWFLLCVVGQVQIVFVL